MKGFISDAHLASRCNDVIQDHLGHFFMNIHSRRGGIKILDRLESI